MSKKCSHPGGISNEIALYRDRRARRLEKTSLESQGDAQKDFSSGNTSTLLTIAKKTNKARDILQDAAKEADLTGIKWPSNIVQL